MKRWKKVFSNWKLPAILLVTAFLGLVSLPAQYQPSFLPESIKNMNINLGLDLQGGSQLDYKIDLRKVDEADQPAIVEGILNVINERVNSLGVSEPNIYTSQIADEQHIIVELAGVKDIESAKEQVGKTIQLEFKEENENPSAEDVAVIEEQANNFLAKIKSEPENFVQFAQEENNAYADRITFVENPNALFLDQISSEEIKAEVQKLEAGQVSQSLIEATNTGYVFLEGRPTIQQGLAAIQMVNKEDVDREFTEPKEVNVSHILIAYKGASSSSQERTQEEAKTLAEEVLQKAKAEGADFAALATEYTNDPTGPASGGSLEAPVVDGNSPYVEKFTEASLQLENEGDITETLIETEFGYHIIKADSVKAEVNETRPETQYQFNQIIFTTNPSPWKETGLNGSMFERADLAFNNGVTPIVTIQFNPEGAQLFAELTEANIGKQIAIFVGGELISAPVVNTKITGGEAIIQGQFSIEEAEELARDLNTGAIPAPIVLSGQYTIGASLGQAALASSLNAGIIGLALLSIYMIAYYRASGLIANFALAIYSIILVFLIKSSIPMALSLLIAFAIYGASLAIIYNSEEKLVEKTLSFTVSTFALFFIAFLLSKSVVLTLAGVAGIILSIGMAVDANVLIFERIKEEIRDGQSYKKAVEQGFARAWSSIRDSNFSSLITCGILYFFGSSIIRGFALNLAAGILISMFTAIMVTKSIMALLDKTKLAESKWLLGVDKNSKQPKTINFLGKSKVWFTVSAILIAISIGSLGYKGINAGIDFTGGTQLEVQFPEGTNTNNTQLAALVEGVSEDLSGTSVVTAGQDTYLIKTKFMEEETYDLVIQSLKDNVSTEVVENRFTTVGPTISETLRTKAVTALLFALVAIIIYIALTFRNIPKKYSPWKFGFAAMIALAHDVIITLGIFSVFQLEVDALFITALLTVIGFSVHDTIVVFDRIRENLTSFSGKRKKFSEVCNISLSQTLARSINTSVSTLLTLLALLILGSGSIQEFILALVIGIGIGTYSSIFIASPSLNRILKKK